MNTPRNPSVKALRLKIRTAKNPYGEISVRQKFIRQKLRKAKIMYSEKFIRRKFHKANSSTAKIPTSKIPAAMYCIGLGTTLPFLTLVGVLGIQWDSESARCQMMSHYHEFGSKLVSSL